MRKDISEEWPCRCLRVDRASDMSRRINVRLAAAIAVRMANRPSVAWNPAADRETKLIVVGGPSDPTAIADAALRSRKRIAAVSEQDE